MIDIEVGNPGWTRMLPDAEALVSRVGLHAMEYMQVRGGISVLLADDDVLRDLNTRFRNKPVTTNVLSFPAPENPEDLLGDIALALGVCEAEAAAQSKSLAHHVSHLLIHGILHLLGYDHMGEDEAAEMEDLEREILAGLGISDPYLLPAKSQAGQDTGLESA